MQYANDHFADPRNVAHSGMETDRGRFYVMFGVPDGIERFAAAAYEIWQYPPAAGERAAFRIQFSVPPIDSCDGSYRILSPPIASFKGKTTSVDVYPRGSSRRALRLIFPRLPASPMSCD